MKNIVIAWGFLASFSCFACGNAEPSQGASAPSNTQQTLSAVGTCAFAVCGSLPSKLAMAASVQCAGGSSEGCAWSASDAAATTSYRPCAASECPVAPAIDCPAGTVQSSQQCGSENDAACIWTTVCVPPRATTACPDANGCGAQPELGVVCSDGTSGALVCATNGQQCSWQRNCD